METKGKIAVKRVNHVKKIQEGWQNFFRSHGCGICAIPELIEAGISGLKLVGRGSALSFKVENIKMVLEALNIHNELQERATTVKRLKELYLKRFNHPCSPYLCYFPERVFEFEETI